MCALTDHTQNEAFCSIFQIRSQKCQNFRACGGQMKARYARRGDLATLTVTIIPVGPEGEPPPRWSLLYLVVLCIYNLSTCTCMCVYARV